MIGLLEQILCWIRQFGAMVLNALVGVVNLLVSGLQSFVQAILDAQIPFPELPDVPAQLVTAAAWISWFFPVGTLLTVLATFGTLSAAWWVVSIALRWAKAVE